MSMWWWQLLIGIVIGYGLPRAFTAVRQHGVVGDVQRRLNIRARKCAFWVLSRTNDPAVDNALKKGFQAAGLNERDIQDSFNLMATGKWHEVAYYAGQQLGHKLSTVGELRAILEKLAPQ